MNAPLLFQSMAFFFIVSLGTALFPQESMAVQLITQADCGSTFSENNKIFILAKNIQCGGSIEHALKFSGDHITLLLVGHKIKCENVIENMGVDVNEENVSEPLVDDGIEGIILAGTSSLIKGPGTVHGCTQGVVLAGGGNHTVKKVKAKESVSISGTPDQTGNGFFITSSQNLLLFNEAKQSGFDGFVNEGNFNSFLFNHAKNSFDDGFDETGEQNKYSFNRAMGNGGSGFQTASTTVETRFTGNTGNKNGFAGFHLINCLRCSLRYNTANKNFKFDGVDPGDGIQLEGGAKGTTVKGNTMKNNEGIDAVDENENCDENTWKKNTFETSEVNGGPNPGCIN